MADPAPRSRTAPRILSRDDVLRLAHLARLALTDTETEDFADQLSAILAYIEQLETVSLASTEPDSASDDTPSAGVVSSLEAPGLSLTPETVLGNAPKIARGLIAVPSVIDADVPDPVSDSDKMAP